MYRVACVLLLSVSTLYADIRFKDCGSAVGRFNTITVSGCDTTKDRCILRRNTNASIGIQFEVDKDVTSIVSAVHGVLAGLPVPFPIKHPDACSDSGLTCPLATGGPYNFVTTLFVEPFYPAIPVTVRWELKDQEGRDIVCVEIPARIQ